MIEYSLKGKRVLITREKSQAEAFSKIISEYGGIPIEVPLLEIVCQKKTKQDFHNLSFYEWIFFTSANGVNCFFELIKEHNLEDKLNGCNLAVVGHKTEEALKNHGFYADFVPSIYNAETMAEEFMSIYPTENKGPILLVRGSISRPTLPVEFKKNGYQVDLIEVYETVSNERMKIQLNQHIKEGLIDFVTFTSPSTVHSFMQIVDPSLNYKDLICVCIGTTTEKAAKEAGFNSILIPNTFTIEGMVEKMLEYVNEKGLDCDGK